MVAPSIECIVDTYELPKRTRDRVLAIASSGIRRLGLVSFNDQYRYVAELVDKFQATREDRNAVSLDSPIKGDGRTWHDVLSYGKNPYEDEEWELTLNRAVDISDKFLVEKHREVTRRLLGDSNPQSIMDLTPDELFADFFGISLRSEAVARYLERGGKIYPERRMIYVNLDSENPWIQWGTRKGAYNKDPLSYFRRHQDVYGRFRTRSQLECFDSGLVASLRKHDQIDLAIPALPIGNQPKEFTDEEIKLVVDLYNKHGGNGFSVIKKLKMGRRTLKRILERQGIEMRHERGPPDLPRLEEERIVGAHQEYDASCYSAKQNLPYAADTIIRYWRKNGLEILAPHIPPSRILSQQRQERILAAHKDYRGSARAAEKALGHSKTTIIRYWRKAGLVIREPC